jgi:DNA polymerase III alpha subunit/very-short-patch-repair endonuclease
MEFIEVIEKKEFDYSGFVHDLNINEDHTYNINGYAVHNSGAGSLVVCLLGITKIDPIKYGLYFERFLNEKRLDPPDIDLDFDSKTRYKIEAYLKQKYGEHAVSHVISFGTFGIKNSIRDTFRVYFGTDKKDEINKLSKCLEMDDTDFDLALQKMIALEGDWAKEFIEEHKKQFDIARVLVGKNRHYSMHAGGVIIAPDYLEKFIPIMRIKDQISTGYPEGGDTRLMTDAGLMKFDILGLNACSIINDALRQIKNITISTIIDNDDDSKVLEQFTIGNTFSIFQFEGKNITKFIKRAKPTKFIDLVAVNALYRPAVIQAGGLEMYLKNKKNYDYEKSKNDPFERVLSDSYGLMLYQESSMRVFQELGGFTLAEADESRHVFKLLFKGKTDYTEFNHMMDKFRAGCHKNTDYSDKRIEEIMEIMKNFSKYSFNRCISEDSKIIVYKKIKCHKENQPNACRYILCNITISELYENINKYSGISVYDYDKKVSFKAPIKDVIKTGIKEVYYMCVKSSKRRHIYATLEHKFFTPEGWKELRELKVGDEVLIKKGKSVNAGINNAFHPSKRPIPNKGKKSNNKNKLRQILPKEYVHQIRSEAAKNRKINGHSGCKHSEASKELMRQRTIARYVNGKFPNKDTSINKKVFEFVSELKQHQFVKEYSVSLGVVDIAEPNLKIAIECQGTFFHADYRFYPDKTKLSAIQRKNKRRDFLKKRWMRQNGWTLIELWEEDINNDFEFCKQKILDTLLEFQQNPFVFEKITLLQKYGEKQTYDIHVDHPNHNYIANFFVVHNSHSCAYAMMAYIMMYLRTYYPNQYFSSLLSNTENTEAMQDGKKVNLFQNYVTEIQKNFNIKICKPDINESGAHTFRIKEDGSLVYALGHIKDVGSKAAVNIEENQPYSSFKEFLSKVTRRIVNKRVIRALVYSEAIKFDDTAELFEKEIGEKIDTTNFLQKQFDYTGLVASQDLKEATDREYSLKGVEKAAAQGKTLSKRYAIPIIVFVSKFRRLAGNSKRTGKPYVMYFATIYDGTTRIDDCILNDAEGLNIEEGDLVSGRLYFDEAKNKKYSDHVFYLGDIKKIKNTEKYDALGKLNLPTSPKIETPVELPKLISRKKAHQEIRDELFKDDKSATITELNTIRRELGEPTQFISRKKRVAVEEKMNDMIEKTVLKFISRKKRSV